MNRNYSVKKVCALGLLTAITIILAMFCTFRVGNFIKIPFKFISIFVTAAAFGPFWGGTVAAIGDIFNAAFTVGINPIITVVEFLCGFVYGVLFYKRPFKGKGYILRVLLCTVIMFLIDIFITSYILTSMGIFPSYSLAIAARFLAGILKAVLQLGFMLLNYKLQLQKLVG